MQVDAGYRVHSYTANASLKSFTFEDKGYFERDFECTGMRQWIYAEIE